uniref:Uncharacterized protein n=1 Tax=Ciona intestinalis TaxID=7719 RepID=F6ZJS9_CIOIN
MKIAAYKKTCPNSYHFISSILNLYYYYFVICLLSSKTNSISMSGYIIYLPLFSIFNCVYVSLT